MRVVTWNLAKRAETVDQAGVALAEMRPDLVLLQAVTQPMVDRLRVALLGAGLHWHAGTIAEARRAGKHAANLVASRWKCDRVPSGWAGHGLGRRSWLVRYNRIGRERPPWNGLAPRPWLLLRVSLQSPWGEIVVINAHTPSKGRNPWDKVKAIDSLTATLGSEQPGMCIVGGDFEAPRKESAQGVRGYGRGHDARGELWDEAELGMVGPAARHGLIDSFRALHPIAEAEGAASCLVAGGKRRRFDHLFASAQFQVQSAEYHPEWMDRPDGRALSDHAPLLASYEVRLVPVGRGYSIAPAAPPGGTAQP